MAKLNVYVPDDLKARMDGVSGDVNWSEVVRPALQAAVADEEHRRNRSMDTVIERLRASKQEALRDQETKGKKEGRRWAEDHASYDELRLISKIELGPREAADYLIEALDLSYEELAGKFGEGVTDEYLIAWIESVQEFFAEVEDKL
jgi:hypothetical protein